MQIFVDFIKLADQLDWINALKRAEKVRVFHVISETGYMDVRHNAFNQKFIPKSKEFVTQYS